MAKVVVAASLTRWLSPTPMSDARELCIDISGTTVKQVLAALFAIHPQLRDYVIDERGALRHHVVAFVDGAAVQDKGTLSESVHSDSEVYIFQALSGG